MNLNCDDILLVKKSSDNDIKAQKILYLKYKKIIKDYLYSKYGYYSDIDDDVSEIIIKIFCNLKNYDSTKAGFKTWVFQIANNYMKDKFKTNKTNNIDIFPLDCTTVLNSNTISYSYVVDENIDTSKYICQVSSILPYNEFILLSMKYFWGYSFDEISREFNVDVTDITNKISYLRTKVKNCLNYDYVNRGY